MFNIKRCIVIPITLCLTTIIYDQELKVDYFAERQSDITARSKPREYEGKYCAFIKVLLASPKATFEGLIVGDVAYKNSEYSLYLHPSSKRLVVKMEGYLPLEVKFKEHGIDSLESKHSYILKLVFESNDVSEFKKKNVYVEPLIQLGGMTAFGASLGGYVNHLNVEAFYMMGLAESEEIFWNDNNTTANGSPMSYTYKPSYYGGKVGYAFYLGRPFRITPQVGVGVISLTGSEGTEGNKQIDAKNGYAINASASVKIDYLILPWLGVGVTPEYSLTMNQSDLYERVAAVSSKVDGFAKGFNVRLGVFITF